MMSIRLSVLILVLLLSSASAEEYGNKVNVFFYASALEDLDEGALPGQYGAGIGYFLTHRIRLEGVYTRGTEDRKFPIAPDPETGFPGFTETSNRTVQTFGGRVSLLFSNGRVQPYVIGGLGFLHDRAKGTSLFYADFEAPPQIVDFDETKTSLFVEGGAGIKYYFSRRVFAGAETALMMKSSPWFLKGALSLGYEF